MRRAALALVALSSLLVLGGCDLLGIEGATVVAERKVAEGKAVGAACRHAGRAIEDCYTLNKKAEKAAIYAGWREMDDYMRENKLEPVPPQLSADAKGKGGSAESDAADEAGDAKAPAKSDAKMAAKSESKADGKEHASTKKGASTAH